MREHRSRPGPFMARVALLCLFLGLTTTGCEDEKLKADNAKLQAELTELKTTSEQREQYLNDVATSLNSVEEALEQVRQQELTALKQTSRVDQGTEKSNSQKEQMLQNIRDLRKVLEDRKAELTALEGRLETLKGEKSGLQKTVAKLRKLIAEREARITQLETAVNDRDAKIAVLETVLGEKTQLIDTQTAQIQEKDTVIQEQSDKLNTGYFVAGTKDYLKTQGIIKETGGVLGLGKSQVTSELPEQQFRPVSIKDTTEIPLSCGSEKVKLISSHPPGSYEITAAGDKDSILKITNADQFWKSRYLVVMLKCEPKQP